MEHSDRGIQYEVDGELKETKTFVEHCTWGEGRSKLSKASQFMEEEEEEEEEEGSEGNKRTRITFSTESWQMRHSISHIYVCDGLLHNLVLTL